MEQALNKIANYLHAVTLLAVLVKIWYSRNCSGVSGKTQLLYILTYTTRYLDLFVTFTTIENAAIKIAFILMGYLTLMSIYVFFKDTNEREHDTFRIELIVLPCLVAAGYINKGDATFIGISYNFSLYLEAFAIIPQFHFISKAGKVHESVLYYTMALFVYKALKNLHHCLAYEYDNIAIACGIIQILFYCDFFVQILPHLSGAAIDRRLHHEQQVATVNAIIIKRDESGGSDAGGYFSDNVGPILFLDTNDKMNPAKSQETMEKY